MSESLNGTYEIHEDGSVSVVTKFAGSAFVASLSEMHSCGFSTAGEYANWLEQRYGYERRIPMPSGSALTVSGGYITGRIEPQPEPYRAPLPHFNQRTEFDPFKGFYNHPDARIRSSYVGFVTIEPEPNPDALPANVNLLRG